MSQRLNVGIYLFDSMTMLDAYAPLQILSFVEQFNTFTVAKQKALLKSDCGALLTPDHDFESCPDLDIIVVPGGGDVLGEMTDTSVIEFLQKQGAQAKYITSVCTGALILAEAGLLDGHRATTHWAYLDQLARFPGIETLDGRVVVDKNRITGGGITAGIDFALTLVSEVVSAEAAQTIQLIFEYRPQPPFDSGSPASAPDGIVAMVRGIVAEKSKGLSAYMNDKYTNQN
jgi:cyclohexyl-isocyanide hydratase